MRPIQYAPAPCKWWLDFNGHPERSAWRSLRMSVIVLHPSTKSESFRFWIHGWFSVTALIGLVILTFDLLISKWGHGSPVSRSSFLPMFSFLCPFVVDLWSGTWQTDRRTDRRRPSMYDVLPVGRGIITHKVTSEMFDYNSSKQSAQVGQQSRLNRVKSSSDVQHRGSSRQNIYCSDVQTAKFLLRILYNREFWIYKPIWWGLRFHIV